MTTKGAVYAAYLQREGPKSLGTVDWPKEREGAFTGKKFLSTGVFETIIRDDLINIIKKSGGHVMSGISKNLDYLIVGRDAGPTKLKKAEELGLKVLTEEETFEMFKKVLTDGEDLPEGQPKPSASKRKAPARSKSKKNQESDSEKSSEDEKPTSKRKPTKTLEKKSDKKSSQYRNVKKETSGADNNPTNDTEDGEQLGDF